MAGSYEYGNGSRINGVKLRDQLSDCQLVTKDPAPWKCSDVGWHNLQPEPSNSGSSEETGESQTADEKRGPVIVPAVISGPTAQSA
jgi:hypothetical protein